jgi:hypothetical protein
MKKKLDDVMSAPVLDENHVTIETLKEILDAAHHDCEVMVDGTLCMSGTDLPRPVWITINPDRKHLTFSTYDWPPPYKNGADLLALVNALNATSELVKFHVADGNLYGEHMLTYTDGLIVKQFVVLVRKIARLYEAALANSSELRALA